MASAAAGGGAPKPYLYLSSLVMRAAAHAPPPTRISSVKLPPALSTLHGLPRDKPFDVTTLLLPPRLWQQQPPSRHDPATATLALRIQIAQLRRVDTSEPFAEAKALTTVLKTLEKVCAHRSEAETRSLAASLLAPVLRLMGEGGSANGSGVPAAGGAAAVEPLAGSGAAAPAAADAAALAAAAEAPPAGGPAPPPSAAQVRQALGGAYLRFLRAFSWARRRAHPANVNSTSPARHVGSAAERAAAAPRLVHARACWDAGGAHTALPWLADAVALCAKLGVHPDEVQPYIAAARAAGGSPAEEAAAIKKALALTELGRL